MPPTETWSSQTPGMFCLCLARVCLSFCFVIISVFVSIWDEVATLCLAAFCRQRVTGGGKFLHGRCEGL